MLFAHLASWKWCEVQEDKGYEIALAEERCPSQEILFWLIFSEFLVQKTLDPGIKKTL